MPFEPYQPVAHPSHQIVEVLAAARRYLTDPTHWTQNVVAENGRRCSVGAVLDAVTVVGAGNTAAALIDQSLRLLDRALPASARFAYRLCWFRRSGRVALYNDCHSHQDVLALFDRAIQQAVSTTRCRDPVGRS